MSTSNKIKIRRAYAETPHGQLHYRYAGEGPPLLLLHQTATSSACYEGVMSYLAPSCRALAVDTPGFGMSDRPHHARYTVTDYVNSFAAFLHSLGISRASVFGHHTGATFACELAAAYPELVDKLILNGAPYWKDPIGEFLNRVKHIVVKEDGSHLIEVWRDLYARIESFYPRPMNKEILRTFNQEVILKLIAGERYHEAYVAISNYDIMARLPLIKAPTLVMSGEKDSIRNTLEPVAARIRRVRTYVGPGGSYLMTYEDPQALARVILDFLAKPSV